MFYLSSSFSFTIPIAGEVGQLYKNGWWYTEWIEAQMSAQQEVLWVAFVVAQVAGLWGINSLFRTGRFRFLTPFGNGD
jgi:hypothetical protein